MIIPTFPITELIDRYLIAQLKYEKTNANIVELEFYQDQVAQIDLDSVSEYLQQLKTCHRNIWELEKELKNGYEQQLPLEEIGRRAILIRNENAKRVLVKNFIAEKLGCNVREIKQDHLSE